MKVLITGATGFLGRSVLRRLLDDDGITEIIAVSRMRDSYPHPKVNVVKLDLSVPTGLNLLSCDFDMIIHLAGTYDFTQSYSENYLNNVLSMIHLVSWLEDHGAMIPVHYASTYAVCCGLWNSDRAEAPVEILPPKSQPYALSKAIAERLILKAKFPVVCYRLGSLVGNGTTGDIEKVDGPYYVLRLLLQIAETRVGRYAPFLPFPAKASSFLPLVPVDAAARVIHGGLSRQHEPKAIYGVYNPNSLSVAELIQTLIDELGFRSRPVFLPHTPKVVERLQEVVTGVPEDLFDFAKLPERLENEAFREHFGDLAIPAFGEYKDVFVKGYENFIGRRLG